MKKVNPSRLIHRVELGIMEDQDTKSGIRKPRFVKKSEYWCSIFSLSTAETIRVMGTEQAHSKSILIRTLKDGLGTLTHAKFKGEVYQISSYHPDADNEPKSFDLLVLKKEDKNG